MEKCIFVFFSLPSSVLRGCFPLTQRTDIFVSSSLFYRHIMTWQISQHVLNMPTIFIYIPVLVELISSLSTFSNRTRQGIPCYRNHHGPSPGTLSSASRGPTTPVACQKSPVPWELQDSAARAFWRSGKVSKIHTDPKGDSFWNWECLSMYKPLEGGRFELLSISQHHFHSFPTNDLGFLGDIPHLFVVEISVLTVKLETHLGTTEPARRIESLLGRVCMG